MKHKTKVVMYRILMDTMMGLMSYSCWKSDMKKRPLAFRMPNFSGSPF